MPTSHNVPVRYIHAVSILLLLWCSSDCAVALRGSHPNRRLDRSVIERMEVQWRTAVIQGDAAALEKLLADDFLSISSNGTLADKQEFLQRIATHKHIFTRLDMSETKIRMQPESAIVTSRADVEGRADERPIQGIFRYTRVYTRRAGSGWKVVNFEITRVKGNEAGNPDLHSGVPVRR